jgi:hypothetical protein
MCVKPLYMVLTKESRSANSKKMFLYIDPRRMMKESDID